MSSRKILPSPPGSTMSLAPESRRSVSPIDQAAYHDTEQLNPTVYTTPTTSHTSTRSNEKAHHSTSDQTVFLKEPCVRPSPQWKDSSYWWPWEWLCELLAIGSLGAMIIVLMWYRDKPQSEWRQSYFTLNGLIAFLATLTKTGLIIPVSAAIGQRKWLRFMPNKRGQRSARKLGDFEMFDEASRGSLGSTKLMFSLNFWDVACLGAFITIVSVFFSAITQNVLGTYVSMKDGRSLDLVAGRVPRSDYFNLTDQPPASELTFSDQYFTDVSALAAIYNGIISDNIDDVPISCATGNCTWPIIPTAGICGACVDMSTEVITNCGGGSMSQVGGCYFAIPGGTNLTRPTELPLPLDTTPIFIAGPGSDYIFNQTDVVGEGVIYGKMSFNFIGQSYSHFVDQNQGSWIPANRTVFNRASVKAYECGLWNCVQSRAVNASNGIVQDNIVGFLNGRNKSTVYDPMDGNDHFLDDPSFNIDNITSYDRTGNDNAAQFGMQATLEYALSGSITINAMSEVDFTPTIVREPSEDPKNGTINGLAGSAADCLHAAWVYADDIDKWWARLAKSLTNNVRMNGGLRQPEQGRYDGIAWTEVVHVEVRWLWLIFPASLVFLSTIFLIATMIASWQSGLRPWKSFVLPVLYTRLEEGLQEEWRQENVDACGSLAEVKDRWVGLDSNSSDDWTFRHVTKQSIKEKEGLYAVDVSLEASMSTEQ